MWLVFGTLYLIKQLPTDFNRTTLVVLTTFLFIDALLYFLFGFLNSRKSKLYFLLLTLFIVGNSILTITDEFGIFDFFVLVIDAVIIFKLLRNRDYYLGKSSQHRS